MEEREMQQGQIEQQKYIIQDYIFEEEQEFLQAKKERDGVEFLRSKMDMNNSMLVFQQYHKLLKKKMFRTPIGLDYLIELQNFLMANPQIESRLIQEIPKYKGTAKKKLVQVDWETRARRAEQDKLKQEIREKKKYRIFFLNSLIINLLLVIVIIAMFVIARNSKNVNITNYEERLLDKYSKWEESLKERESSIQSLDNQKEDENSQK